jgi:hypothetical protein
MQQNRAYWCVMKPLEEERGRLGKRGRPQEPEKVEATPSIGLEGQQESVRKEHSELKDIPEPRRTSIMSLQVTKCEAAPQSITVFFSEDVNQSPPSLSSNSALAPGNYTIYAPPKFNQPTVLSSVSDASITTFGKSAVRISFASEAFSRGNLVMITGANIKSANGADLLDSAHATTAGEVNGKNALRIVNCVANPSNLTVSFSEPLDTSQLGSKAGTDPSFIDNYSVTQLPSSGTNGTPVTIKAATFDAFHRATFLELQPNQLQRGQWVLVTVNNVASEAGPITNGGNNTFSSRVDGGSDADRKLKKDVKEITESVEDAVAFPLLTEPVNFSGGMPISSSGRSGSSGGTGNGTSLGQIATNAITDVLGWKTNSADPKGFIGALTQSFSLQEVEGHTEASWIPRTYAVQTDIGGGITGAQASLYTRAKDALDKALPLLDGLYPLDPDADPEFVKAIREMARSQMMEIVKELGAVGGPSILRVNTYFGILLGENDIKFQPPTQPEFDPDKVQGTLGTLRDTYGIYFLNNPFSNSVEDEQDITNFRVISDYMTSLLQSWISNGQFFQLGSTQQNFFGTQLVLLSRQFSVVAETVNELRFTLDSVFIGPSERQTLLLQFATFPSMFLEDVLREVEDFATAEGPRLLQDGGRISVPNNILPVLTSLSGLIGEARRPVNIKSLPEGYRTVRVQRALDDLNDQVKELINLAVPVGQEVPPPVQEPQEGFQVLNLTPNSVSASRSQKVTIPITIIGTGFRPGATLTFTPTSLNAPIVTAATPTFLSENLLVAQVTVDGTSSQISGQSFSFTVTARNANGSVSAPLLNGFTTIWLDVASQTVTVKSPVNVTA